MRAPRLRKLYTESAAILRRKPRVSAVYLLLRFFVILTMIAQFFNRNFQNVFLGLLTLILFVLPSLLAACDRFVSRSTTRKRKDMEPI